MRDIGNPGEQFLELLIDRVRLLVQRGDLFVHLPNRSLKLGGVRAASFKLADLHAFGVLARLELLGLGDERTALRIQLAKAVDWKTAAASCQPFGHTVKV